ncbi:MAG: sigma-70 family RNA polymerase sigma factor [Gemmataceae bacterium]|nr:sigma-70 family RNA polymerase sigma factor [Gemmataceae bacterium]
MTSRHERDEWLMVQVAQGKREYLETLIRRYASPLLTFIQRMIGDRHKSEDVFQEVFLAVWAKRQQYEFPRPFKAWLYAIAANKCHALGRRRSLSITPLGEEASASGTTPADTAIATETASLVTSAVAQLPTQQRAVVAMRVWNGMSYADIAEALDRTEATVRSHMHHGLIAMREFLQPRLNPNH